jgi:hypothetical protein
LKSISPGIGRRIMSILLTLRIKVINFIKETHILILVGLSAGGGVAILFAGSLISSLLFPDLEVPPLFSAIVVFVASMIWSFGGIAQIIKREMYGPMGITIRGKLPVVIGVLGVGFFWIMGFSVIILAILGQ